MPNRRDDRAPATTWHMMLNGEREDGSLTVTFYAIRWVKGLPHLHHRESVTVPDHGHRHHDARALRAFTEAIATLADV